MNQRPARVSSALRSSTAASRAIGTAVVSPRSMAPGRRAAGPVAVVALMQAAPSRTSRWVSEVRERKRSSSPPSAARRSVRTIACSAAARPTSTGGRLDPQAVTGRRHGEPALAEDLAQQVVVEGRDVRGALARTLEQRLLGALSDDAAVPDQHHLVGDQLDLVEQVAGEQDGAAAVGVPLEQATHPADAGRVEAVGGLVEDEHRRVAEQGVGDAEPLLHAERVVAQPTAGLGGVQRHQGEHLVDPRHRQAHRPGADGEDLATGAAGVLGGGVEQDPHVATRVGDVAVGVAADGDPARRGRRQPHHDPHRGRLAGAVGAQEARHPARARLERDVVDGREGAVRLREAFYTDHGSQPARRRARGHRSQGWTSPLPK